MVKKRTEKKVKKKKRMNEWNNAICSNMHGPRDYHTKWDKSKIKRQIPHDVTYMWNLKCDTNELIYKTDS